MVEVLLELLFNENVPQSDKQDYFILGVMFISLC